MLDNERFGKRLVKAGVITQEQLDEALRHQELQEGRLGEILVRLGYVSESTILQFLAAEFRTRYVSTERLARARIPQQVLDLLPVHLAERYNLIPVLFDAETSTLSIVTSEPQNEENLREVHMLTSVRELRVYVALQPAVQAAIRKHYRGEINAFKDLLYPNASPIPNTPGNPYDSTHNPNAVENYPESYGPEAYAQGAYDNNMHSYGGSDVYNPNNPYQDYNYPYENPNDPYNPGYNANQYSPQGSMDYQPYDPNQAGNYSYYPHDDQDEVTRLHPGPYLNNYEADQSQQDSGFAMGYGPTGGGLEPMVATASSAPLGQVQVLPLTRMLVTQLQQLHPRYQRLLERQRPLLQAVLRKLIVSLPERQPIWLAFYLHHIDLPDPLPTLLNMSEDQSLHDTSKREHMLRMRRLQHLQLPEETLEILQHVYERADGEGFPGGLLRQEIPLGARLLAILDAFEELQSKHQIPSAAGDQLSNQQLLEKLKEHTGTLFDPKLLEIFEEELPRLDKYQRGEIPKVMLLDQDVEALQDLARILWDRNFWVYLVGHPSEAEEICLRENIDLIVLEVTLPGDRDGFAFVEELKGSLENPPEFIFYTTRDGQDELDRGMSLARDYVPKSTSANLMATKLNKNIQQIHNEKAAARKAREPKQLSGSLQQLGLAELIQFLSQGRRSGRVTIEAGKDTGHIFLDQGQVINATLRDQKGEDALGVMITWEKGTFTLNPSITTDERLIHKHTDGLLLDLLRIMDEAKRDGVDPFASASTDGNEETDFSGLGDFDFDIGDSKDDVPAQEAAKAEQPKKKSGLFGDIGDDDFDDVFSESFKDASRDNLKKTD